MLAEPPLPLVFTRAQALRMGLTRHAVTWRAGHGQWQTLRRGAFCRSDVYDALPAEDRHLVTALSALSGPFPRVEAISHLTAALVYGWPGPLQLDECPWFTIAPGPGPGPGAPTRRRSGVVRQVAPLPDGHVWTLEDVPFTSAARTVADCLRHYPADVSVPIADAALRAGVDVDAIRRILDWQHRWPYAARGLVSVQLVDGRRETWLESHSAVVLHRLGWPMPTAQVDISDERGRHVGRVDFGWARSGVVGESDGWGKYRIAPGGELLDDPAVMSAERLKDEKLREDRLRDLGLEVVRWTTWDTVHPRGGFADRLERAFSRARPDLVRGAQVLAVPERPGPLRAAGLLRLADLVEGPLVLRPDPVLQLGR